MLRPNSLLAGRRKTLRCRKPVSLKPRFESLESRRLLANMRVTSATLVDGNMNPITQPIIGQMLRVRMDYTANNMPANANYSLTWTVQGVPLKVDNVTFGAGFVTSNWFYSYRGWYAESGALHTAQVEVDSSKTVAETDETDNVFSFTFTPVQAVLPTKLSWFDAGTLGVDRTLTNYVDIDPTSGIRDFAGGQSAYDTHEGIDMGSPNNSFMDSGIPILAAAPGTVIEAADGNFDRNRGTLTNIIPVETQTMLSLTMAVAC